ncbi:hypothetical protein [Pedobacter arcticus]|uniref:hypothetical protein n=1 Tax=Pedobacter arcticus TaxID=752140 RepID=UPI0002E0AD10|nr:hypothetical protein [Pedobacter arcticus]
MTTNNITYIPNRAKFLNDIDYLLNKNKLSYNVKSAAQDFKTRLSLSVVDDTQ